MRQAGLAQHEADVRVSDEKAAGIDDVGLAFVADLDARHDVPDELEIHVGHRHRSLVAARADRHRHVRLGLLAKVDRPVPRLPALGIAKRRLLRAVAARRDNVHAEARDGDLLAPAGVELGDVGDFRRLAQQLQEFDAAQLDVGRVELRQRGVGELLRDLADVLLDSRRRTDCFLVLQARECRAMLLVRKVDADRARREQRHRDEREDQQQVLAKQPAMVHVARACGLGARACALRASVDRHSRLCGGLRLRHRQADAPWGFAASHHSISLLARRGAWSAILARSTSVMNIRRRFIRSPRRRAAAATAGP